MNQLSRTAALFILWCFLASVGFAQAVITEDPTIDDLREFRATTERNLNLDEELQARIFESIDAAIASVEAAEANRATTNALSDRFGAIEPQIEALKADLERPDPVPALNLPENPTVDQAEDALARERSRLTANIASLREEQQVAEQRRETRSNIAQRLGELDLELELLNRDLRTDNRAAQSELKLAARMRTLARREAAKSEIEMLRAQLALMSEQSALIPLNVDFAQRRVAISQALVRLHEDRAHELRTEWARTSLEYVRSVTDALVEKLPQIAELANETQQLAETLWGPKGIVVRSEATVSEIDATRTNQAHLNRIAELTARKFEAYGHRGSVKRWWPEIPDGFPEHGTVTRTMQELDEAIPEIEHLLITYEQDRTQAHLLGTEVLQELHDELGEAVTPELVHEVRTLLGIRQDLLDGSISKGRDYSNQLVEYRALIGIFFTQYQTVEKFLFSHVLWSRSVPRPIIPRPSNMAYAASWLTSPIHRETITTKGKLGKQAVFAVGALLMLVGIRRPLHRRLNEITERVGNPEKDNLRLTIEALLITAILAAPLPLALYLLGVAVERLGDSPFWFASAEALTQMAVITVFFECTRYVFAPRGLAEVHFGWPILTSRPSSHGLVVAEALGLPLLYVALHLAFAGMRLNSPAELQIYNNSLGRMAFIAGLALLGLLILALIRPTKKTRATAFDSASSWSTRFAEYPLLNAMLAAYPAVIFATLIPALLAAFGYYMTALLLAYQMLRTLAFALAVLIGGGVFERWRRLSHERRLREVNANPETSASVAAIKTDDTQVRHLFRFTLAVIMAFGLFSIWADALPMFDAFKRVQLLPRVAILEPHDTIAISLGLVGSKAPPSSADTTAADTPPASGETEPAQPSTGAVTSTATHPQTLTLWNLLEAILAGLITFMLVRNLPGIVEIILKRRTNFDRGARFAISTLLRYTITIVGCVAIFGLLGIGWSKVQWLAAALTFGLGFGLQEIVANFVSGLILLVERPVRVGDMVTVGNLMGRVSRIQIRATTITLLDRSEMVVPNKEFITTKLVNWTLSDSKRRIEIPLRVAHGSDLDQVKSLLIGTAKKHPLVLENPAPQALLIEFADDAIIFELRFVVDFGNGIEAKDEVQMAIDQTFKEHGIDFAVPQIKLQLPAGVTRD